MDVDKFQSEITKLNQRLKEHIDIGGKPSDFEFEYRQCIEILISQASNGENWSNAAKHIAFLIYAGCLTEIAFNQTRLAANASAEKASAASIKLAIEQCKAQHVLARNTELKHMSEYFESALIDAPKRAARKAVSNRDDQKLKLPFIDFCNDIVKKGQHSSIQRLDDLLNAEGYDPAVTKITPRTLKAWAKEAGISFKAGAPKKK
uniref:Uncharacterized protein n=1 Tax=Dechloromonas aromatica (strain RCB) TaxID=159087 RepID=Q47CK1_DECAR